MGRTADEATKDGLIKHLREVHKMKNLQYPSHWTKAVLVEAHRDYHAKETA